jgi:flagellar biosynthesis/type III secretory pathway M-ring protein FliF/YscJ
MEFLDRAQSQLSGLYRSLTPGGRMSAGLLAAAVLLGLVYLGTGPIARPEADLMHGVPIAAVHLPPMEAAFAKANLTSYEIRGTSIFVPRGQEAAYRAALVKEKALPPNFGEQQDIAANDGGFLQSPAERDLRIKNAKQRDLSLAICAMPGIERAQVLYDVDNRPGPFKDKLITATIIVKPTGTSQVEESRVLDIRNLVAGAIAGLKPENVTVSDLNGPTWHGNWQKKNPGGAGLTGQAAAPAEPNHRRAEESAASQPVPQPPSAALAEDAWHWLARSWRTLVLIGAALACLLALRSMFRAAPGAADVPLAAAESGAAAAAKPGRAPPPHWRRPSPVAVAPPSEELSKLIQDDPEAAASILRNWIG